MNITTGTGQSSWRPRRLSVTDTAENALGAEVITAQFTYGPLGACQGGTLAVATPVWAGAARDRRIDVVLDSEHGTGTVFTGVLDQGISRPGELADAGLLPPHAVYTQALGGGVTYSGLAGNQRTYGVEAPYAAPYQTRQEVIEAALAPYPNSEFGVGPDRVAVLGRPESADPTRASAVGAISVVSQGRVIPDYATDAVFDPGDGWQKYTWSRSAPAYTERRTVTVAANPATVSGPENQPLSRSGPTDFQSNMNHHDSIYADGQSRHYVHEVPPGVIPGSMWPPVEFARYSTDIAGHSGTSKAREMNLRFPFRLGALEFAGYYDDLPAEQRPAEPGATLRMVAQVNGQGTGVYETQLLRNMVGLELAATFAVPGDLLVNSAVVSVELSLMLDQHSTLEIAFHQPTATAQVERPNVNGVVFPPSWSAPFITEPTYQIKLPGWHVPPLIITDLPGGAEQYAAGATVTWSREECSTLVTTVAWPYPGQKRGR